MTRIFFEHFGELLLLFDGQAAKGDPAKRLALLMLPTSQFAARPGELDEQLATVLGVARALDEPSRLHLGEDLGKRPGLELKVRAEFLL